MAIELGREVRDKVTGFRGIATARCEFLYGCVRVGITPKIKKDGTPQSVEYFDEPQIEYVGKRRIGRGSNYTGGPMPSIPTHNAGPR